MHSNTTTAVLLLLFLLLQLLLARVIISFVIVAASGLGQQSDDRMRRGGMMSESRGACNHRCYRGARVIGQFSGAFLNPASDHPLGKIAAAEDPPAERGAEGSVARSGHGNPPSSPSKAW